MVSDLGPCAAASVTGQVRERNEDSAYAGRWLYAVADGLGGHPGGDLASAVAIRALARCDEPPAGDREPEQALRRAFAAAAEAVAKIAAAQPDLAAMATTLTALLRSDDRVVLGHIGDSRAYRLRGRVLRQLSRDHGRRGGRADGTGRRGREPGQRHRDRHRRGSRRRRRDPRRRGHLTGQESRAAGWRVSPTATLPAAGRYEPSWTW